MFDFQSEALTRIGVAAPELSAYVLSFQDLSHELPEGNTLSVGLLTLGAPAGLYYIPVVANGAVVQPFDSFVNAVTGNFLPFTNTNVQKVLTPDPTSLGKSTRIPKNVPTNISVRHLVVPPRTGKVAYASAEPVLEMLGGLPDSARIAILGAIKSDDAFASAIGNVFDIKDFIQVMNAKATAPTVTVSSPSVEVITSENARGRKDLEEVAIQDILNSGYHIKGDNVTPRLALPAGLANDKFTQLSGARQGTAVMLVGTDGSRTLSMVPQLYKKEGGIVQDPLMPAVGWAYQGRVNKPKGVYLAIGVDGTYSTDGHAVVSGEELDMSEAVKELYNAGRVISANQAHIGETIVLLTSDGAIGPLNVNGALSDSTGVTLSCRYDYSVYSDAKPITVVISEGFKGTSAINGSTIYVNVNTYAVVLSGVNYGVETNLSVAASKQHMHTMGLLDSRLSVTHQGVSGAFAVNGHHVGDEAGLARTLVIDIGMSKQAALAAINEVKTAGSAEYLLAKRASFDTYDDIPSYGVIPEDQPQQFDPQPVVQAAETQDPEVMGSVIVSQFLNNPDVYEYVSSYLPQMEETVDKLGRTILLLRLNTDAGKASAITNIMASTRNTYRLLGDSVEKLRRLTDGYIAQVY